MGCERRNLTDFINSPQQLQNQYRNPSNLNARAAIYRFGKPGGTSWTTWVFDRFQFPKNASILEIGCGGGGLWKANLHRVDPTWRITLTDLMPGMLEASREAIGDDPRFNFSLANAMDLPFGDARFDAVVANHMLYHVPDRSKAIGEIARVLKHDGQLYATTNSRRHLEPIKELVFQFLGNGENKNADLIQFVLETGETELQRYFEQIEKYSAPGELAITETQAVVDYLLSIESAPERLAGKPLEELRRLVDRRIAADGAFIVPTESGMFIAGQPRKGGH